MKNHLCIVACGMEAQVAELHYSLSLITNNDVFTDLYLPNDLNSNTPLPPSFVLQSIFNNGLSVK